MVVMQYKDRDGRVRDERVGELRRNGKNYLDIE